MARWLVGLSMIVSIGCGGAAQVATESTVAGAPEQTARSQPPSRSEASAPSSSSCDLSPVYYDLDSSDLSASARESLGSNVRCIAARVPQRVTVIGMADPRGTEEYNLALGERRARAAASYMSSIGADAARIETHSLGEESASGRDESGWQRDRRSDVTIE